MGGIAPVFCIKLKSFIIHQMAQVHFISQGLLSVRYFSITVTTKLDKSNIREEKDFFWLTVHHSGEGLAEELSSRKLEHVSTDVHVMMDQETEKQEPGASYSFYRPISSGLIPPATTYFLKIPQPYTFPPSKKYFSVYRERTQDWVGKLGWGGEKGKNMTKVHCMKKNQKLPDNTLGVLKLLGKNLMQPLFQQQEPQKIHMNIVKIYQKCVVLIQLHGLRNRIITGFVEGTSNLN